MKLEQLEISGLFGHFDHILEFKDGNITIITAPNGYGKTVCLKVIDAIFRRKLTYLCELQFSKIELKTSEGNLVVKKHEEEGTNSNAILLSRNESEDQYKFVQNYEFSHKETAISDIDAHVPFLVRVGSREWEDHRTETIYNYEEVLKNFGEYLPAHYTSKIYPQWYVDFSDSLNSHFIQDQRLIQRSSGSHPSRNRNRKQAFTDTIEKYANELSELIRKSGFNSSHVSQQLDSTFPERLLRKNRNIVPLDPENLKNELQALQARRAILTSYNLLSSAQHLPAMQVLDEIKTEDTKVLTLYVQDTKAKLAAYDGIYRKIELFSRILNTRRLSFKQVLIDSDKGFFFETELKKPLQLTQLSSGEQHQVVLLFELIFKTEENVLVLIDEPEISLHVAWQKAFLNDLREIIDIQDMSVVIATHSPQIIDGNWELTIDLEEGLTS